MALTYRTTFFLLSEFDRGEACQPFVTPAPGPVPLRPPLGLFKWFNVLLIFAMFTCFRLGRTTVIPGCRPRQRRRKRCRGLIGVFQGRAVRSEGGRRSPR